MKAIEGGLRAHLGVSDDGACILWETAAAEIKSFVEKLKGQDVAAVFGNCQLPQEGLVGYTFARGPVGMIAPESHQLFFANGSPGMSLRSLCEIVPASYLVHEIRISGQPKTYIFERAPSPGRQLLIHEAITDSTLAAYAEATRRRCDSQKEQCGTSSMHVLLGVKEFGMREFKNYILPNQTDEEDEK